MAIIKLYTKPNLDDLVGYWDLPKNEAGTLKSACRNKYVVAKNFEDGRYALGICNHTRRTDITFVDNAEEAFIFTSKRAARKYIADNNMSSNVYVLPLRTYLFAE